MSDAVRDVVSALDAVTETAIVWPRGLMHPGGPHRRLRGMVSPISIGEDECRVFERLVSAFRPEHTFVIGNAFGLSAALVAKVMEEHGGKSLVALDSREEGDGERCAGVADALKDRLGLKIATYTKGRSPEDVPKAVQQPVHQLIFIDGLHAHPQVTLDLDATLPYSDDRTVFVWHDFWIPGVPESVDVALQKGFRCLWLPTSCEMVVGARDAGTFQRLRELFPEGQEGRKGHPVWVTLWVVFKLLVGSWMDRLRGRF
jgi:predicted O-methyltransferase YrrM